MRLSHVMRRGEKFRVECKMVALFKTDKWSDQFDALNGGSLSVLHRLGSPQWNAKDLVSLEEQMKKSVGSPKAHDLENMQADTLPTTLKENPFACFLKALHKGVADSFFTKAVSQGAVKDVWVQLVDDPTKPSTATAFEVAPTRNTIDGLKDAIQHKRKEACETVDPLKMKVYACTAEGVWAEVAEDAPLMANAKASAYHVLVP